MQPNSQEKEWSTNCLEQSERLIKRDRSINFLEGGKRLRRSDWATDCLERSERLRKRDRSTKCVERSERLIRETGLSISSLEKIGGPVFTHKISDKRPLLVTQLSKMPLS